MAGDEEAAAQPAPGAPHCEASRDGTPAANLIRWSLAALVFAATFLFRFLDPYFHNEHFMFLSIARQILDHREIPVRDFVDPGFPLQYAISTALQALFGYRLLGEALLSSGLIALGATLTFLLAFQAARSLTLAAVVTTLTVATLPRLYNYPKVVLFVLALAVGWRYVDDRRRRTLFLVGGCTALAFLFRHDYGLYVGAATVALLAATHGSEGVRPLLRRLGLYAAVVGGLLLPYLGFLALHGGLLTHLTAGVADTTGSTRRAWKQQRPRFVLDPAAPLVALRPLPPPPTPRINVRWAKGVPSKIRAALEQQYHLHEPEFLGDDARGRSWQYTLRDTSSPNVGALVRDPHVEDTHGLDRATFRVPPPWEPLLVRWQRRVPPLRLAAFAPGLFHRENAVAWLYYLFLALPLLAVLVLLVQGRRDPGTERLPGAAPKILCAATLCAVAAPVLLRAIFDVRLPDLAAPTAVLGAWLLGKACAGRPLWSWRGLAVVGLLGLTAWSVVLVANPGRQLEQTRLLAGPQVLWQHAARLVTTLRTSPPIDAWAPPGSTGLRGLVRYVRACTAPTDRVLVLGYQPEVYFYAGRGFAGGRMTIWGRKRLSAHKQQFTIAKLRAHSVPITIVPAGKGRHDIIASSFPDLYDHLRANYRTARESAFGEKKIYGVMVDRRVVPTGKYEPLSLPCFK